MGSPQKNLYLVGGIGACIVAFSAILGMIPARSMAMMITVYIFTIGGMAVTSVGFFGLNKEFKNPLAMVTAIG